MHASTPDHLVVTWRNCLTVFFRHETTLAGVIAVQNVYDRYAKEYPSGLCLLTVVERGAPMPPSDVRLALAKFLESGAGYVKMSAVVHEGAGFSAAAVRSVVTGLALLTRLPFPHRVFASVEDAVSWFGSSPQLKVEPARLSHLLHVARSQPVPPR